MKTLLTLLIVCLLGGLFCFTGLASTNGQALDAPTVVSAVAPTYPRFVRGGAGAFDLTGEIFVQVSIDETGNVSSARALNGAPLLQQVAQKAAKRWKFASAAKDMGIRKVRLNFIFRTMPRGTSDEDMSPIFKPPYSVEVRRISVGET
jgi:TonB family protein